MSGLAEAPPPPVHEVARLEGLKMIKTMRKRFGAARKFKPEGVAQGFLPLRGGPPSRGSCAASLARCAARARSH